MCTRCRWWIPPRNRGRCGAGGRARSGSGAAAAHGAAPAGADPLGSFHGRGWRRPPPQRGWARGGGNMLCMHVIVSTLFSVIDQISHSPIIDRYQLDYNYLLQSPRNVCHSTVLLENHFHQTRNVRRFRHCRMLYVLMVTASQASSAFIVLIPFSFRCRCLLSIIVDTRIACSSACNTSDIAHSI